MVSRFVLETGGWKERALADRNSRLMAGKRWLGGRILRSRGRPQICGGTPRSFSVTRRTDPVSSTSCVIFHSNSFSVGVLGLSAFFRRFFRRLFCRSMWLARYGDGGSGGQTRSCRLGDIYGRSGRGCGENDARGEFGPNAVGVEAAQSADSADDSVGGGTNLRGSFDNVLERGRHLATAPVKESHGVRVAINEGLV